MVSLSQSIEQMGLHHERGARDIANAINNHALAITALGPQFDQSLRQAEQVLHRTIDKLTWRLYFAIAAIIVAFSPWFTDKSNRDGITGAIIAHLWPIFASPEFSAILVLGIGFGWLLRRQAFFEMKAAIHRVDTTAQLHRQERQVHTNQLYLIPLGAIIDWYPIPQAAVPVPLPQVPDGFKLCDGSLINDPASPYNGLHVPNLTNRFVRGITTANYVNQANITGGRDDIPYSGDHQHGGRTAHNGPWDGFLNKEHSFDHNGGAMHQHWHDFTTNLVATTTMVV